jgi:hypothetical protein
LPTHAGYYGGRTLSWSYFSAHRILPEAQDAIPNRALLLGCYICRIVIGTLGLRHRFYERYCGLQCLEMDFHSVSRAISLYAISNFHITDTISLANQSEGVATIFCGILAYYTIVDSIASAKFLTAEEREWLLYRKALDAGSAGEAAHVSKKFVVSALTNWQVWLSTGYYMSIVIPLYSIGLFLPTSASYFSLFYVR